MAFLRGFRGPVAASVTACACGTSVGLARTEGLANFVEAIEKEVEEDLILPLRDSMTRYSGYSHYLAYSSDVGESFRAVLSGVAVRATYGLAGVYMVGDVAWNGYLEKDKPGANSQKVALTIAHSALFQFLASLALPFVVIHSTVKFSDKHLFSTLRNSFVRRWGPSAVALAIIPALPLVDEPIERMIDMLFDNRVRCPGCPEEE